MQSLSAGESAGESEAFGIRITPAQTAMVAKERERLQRAAPGLRVTKGDAVRSLLTELERRRAADPTSDPRPALTAATVAPVAAALEAAARTLRGLLEPPHAASDEEQTPAPEATAPKRRTTSRESSPAADDAPTAEALRARIDAAVKDGQHKQSTIAARAGVQPATVSRIVRNGAAYASAETREKIAAALAALGA